MASPCRPRRTLTQSILALVALYAFVAQTLVAAALPMQGPLLPADAAGTVLCAHDAGTGVPSGDHDPARHAACCVAACTFAAAVLPPAPGDAADIGYGRQADVIAWAAPLADGDGCQGLRPGLARGPPLQTA